MQFLTKRFTIFKRSVPVWVLALLFTTIAVAGAFLLVFSMSITGSGAPAPGGALSDITCTLTGIGTVDTCEIAGQDINVVVSGVDDSSSMEVDMKYIPGQPQTGHWDDGAPTFGSITCQIERTLAPISPLENCEGKIMSNGQAYEVSIDWDFSLLSPAEVIDVSPSLEFENN